jgi:hypothetical protein
MAHAIANAANDGIRTSSRILRKWLERDFRLSITRVKALVELRALEGRDLQGRET